MKKTVRPAVKALIQNDGKFLILKKSKSIYKEFAANDLPGGQVEFGEEPLDALRREVMEEIGVEVEIGKPIAAATISKTSERHIVGVIFLCTIKNEKIMLSDEHEEYFWMGKKEIREGKLPNWIKEAVGKV